MLVVIHFILLVKNCFLLSESKRINWINRIQPFSIPFAVKKQIGMNTRRMLTMGRWKNVQSLTYKIHKIIVNQTISLLNRQIYLFIIYDRQLNDHQILLGYKSKRLAAQITNTFTKCQLTKNSTAKINIHALMSLTTVMIDKNDTGNQHINGPQNIIASVIERF